MVTKCKKMKSVKQLSLVLLLSIFVFAAPLANAQKPANASKSQGIENRIPDLTDKQKDEISTLRTAHIKEAQQLKNQMGIKRAELKALQQVENPDIDAINKKIEERAAIRLDLEKKTASFKQSVRNVLTDDQKVIFDQKSSHHSKGNAHNCSHNKQGHSCSKQQQKNCKK
jgi:Spy/CpxP family protein refolding chaperone